MAALTQTAPAGPAQAVSRRNRRRRSLPVWRWAILLVAAVYFLLPLWGALRFSGISAFGGVVDQPGFTTALWLSVRLAIITTVITLVLMVPTTVYVHLRLPKLRRVLDSVTILPIFSPKARISDRSPLAVGLASRMSISTFLEGSSPLGFWTAVSTWLKMPRSYRDAWVLSMSSWLRGLAGVTLSFRWTT